MTDDVVRISRLAVIQYELLLGLLERCRQLPGWSEEDESNMVAALDVSFDRLSEGELLDVDRAAMARSAGEGWIDGCSNSYYTTALLRLTKGLIDATKQDGKRLGLVVTLATYPCPPHGLHAPVTVATGADGGNVNPREVEVVVKQMRITADVLEKKYGRPRQH